MNAPMTDTAPTTLTTTTRIDDDGDVETVLAVRLWDVYQQQWRVIALDCIPDEVLASLPAADRAMIESAEVSQ